MATFWTENTENQRIGRHDERKEGRKKGKIGKRERNEEVGKEGM